MDFTIYYPLGANTNEFKLAITSLLLARSGRVNEAEGPCERKAEVHSLLPLCCLCLDVISSVPLSC